MARLEHPNLVRIYEIGEHDGRPYFSMEYVPGGSLAHALRSTPLPPGKAAALAQTLARAAHAVHERAVVHRDLTPNNVLLGADGEPKIVDFGLAKLVVGGGDQTESGDILGTPSYMAPEQAGGRSKEVGPAPTSTRWGQSSTRCSPAAHPSRPRHPLETLLQVVNHDPVRLAACSPSFHAIWKRYASNVSKRFPRAVCDRPGFRGRSRPLPGRGTDPRASGRRVGSGRQAGERVRYRSAARGLRRGCPCRLRRGHMGRAASATGSRTRETAQAAEKLERLAADEARQRETKERLLYQGVTARLLRDRAGHCNEGDVGRGLLWLTESLRLVPENDPDLGRAIRTNLAGWQTQLHPLRALLEHQGRVMAAAWSPDGRLVLTACSDRNVRLWNAASGELHGKPLRLPCVSPEPRSVPTGS